MIFPAGCEKPHGAENSAVKNTAPFNLTPLRISEKASMSGYPRVYQTICKLAWNPCKVIVLPWPFEQVLESLEHGDFSGSTAPCRCKRKNIAKNSVTKGKRDASMDD